MPRPQPPMPLVDLASLLPARAAVAFEAFSDVVHTPRWFRELRDARVCFRDAAGRATRVQFVSELPPAQAAYALNYRYDANDYAITWVTDAGSEFFLRGEARFVPISAASCLMTYRLERAAGEELLALEPQAQAEAKSIVDQFCAHLARLAG